MIYLIRGLLVATCTVVWGCVALPAFVFDRTRAPRWVARNYMHWCCVVCGVRLEPEGLEQFDSGEPCVVMSNHQSVFDTPALVVTFPLPWKFVAKKELLWVPIFGWALAMADQIVVDRSNHEKSIEGMRRAAERVRAGASVLIFPEGTRSPDARLRPAEEFKSGGFHMAIQAGVPIVPATVSGSQRITPKRSLRVESGRVRIRYGKPIPTRGLTQGDIPELKRQVREAIAAGYDPELQG